jgi:hypothetical protein
MAKMVRKRIYISREQEHLLKRRSKELGVTESALIRQGIDRAARSSSPTTPDEHAWQDALAFMRERARIESAKEQRGWTREDLYEGRPGYLSR